MLRDARYVATQAVQVAPRVKVRSPYDSSLRKQPPLVELPPGIMTYKRAHIILKKLESLPFKYMEPYFRVWERHGTTRQDLMKKQGIKNYNITIGLSTGT